MPLEDKEKELDLSVKTPKRGSLENRKVATAMQAIRQALRQTSTTGSKAKTRSSARQGAMIAKRNPGALRQRVAIRMTYVKNKANQGGKGGHKHDGQWGAHGRYLEREGANREGEKGQGFNAAANDLKISEVLNRWQDTGDELMFKVIISPEFGERMDLRQHCREFMAQMEKDLGTKLEWVAIDHYNTDNPHVHLSIRGVHERGHTLNIPQEYIKAGARIRAAELATKQLGLRNDKDVAEAMQRQVVQRRFTDIDRSIKRQAQNSRVSLDGNIPRSERAREMRLLQINRLKQLEMMGLAEKVGAKTWALNPELESALRQMQIGQDRLKTMYAHRQVISNPQAELVVTELRKPGQAVYGKVVGTGLSEATDKPYILIEGIDGKVHYVTQSASMAKERRQGGLKVGSMAAFQVVELERGGRVIPTVTVKDYGPEITTQLVDQVLLAEKKQFTPQVSTATLAGQFSHVAAHRLQQLIDRGAMDIQDGHLQIRSAQALDRLQFEESGIQLHPLPEKPAMVAKILATGADSVLIQSHEGKHFMLSAEELRRLGTDRKYLKPEALLFIAEGKEQLPAAIQVKQDQLGELAAAPKYNRLDWIAKHVQLPEGHMVTNAIKARQAIQGAAPVVLTPGKEVQGEVVAVYKRANSVTGVVIQTSAGRQAIEQPAGQPADVQPGQKIQAKATEITEQNAQRRTLLWRFADLEREQAKKKGQDLGF